MAGTSTTPELATMPTEIVCMIGAELSVHDIKEWTLASKRFRDIFLTRICKHIKFSGNMEELENNIFSYFQTATTSFKNVVHNHARYVTFDVHAFDTPRGLRAWARAAQQSPISLPRIGQFIIGYPNLHRVNFKTSFGLFKELALFVKLVEAGPQWPNVKNVSVQSPYDNALVVIQPVIEKLGEGALQALSTCSHLSDVMWRMRSSYFANVTSLSLWTQGRDDWWELSHHMYPIIAGLDEGLLVWIQQSFPQLESLVLCDRILDEGTSCGPFANGSMLTLGKTQSLRRFAFDFDKSRLTRDAIPEILEQPPRFFNDMLSDDLDDESVAHFLLLSFLVSLVPTLEEICMTSQYPDFYRVTRRDGELDIDRDSFDDPSQEDLFPSVLMG